MNLDELQKSWQSQDAANKICIHVEALVNEVRREQQRLRRTIFWRDVREVGILLLLVPVFVYFGWTIHWAFHLNAWACFVVAAFFVFDRRRQKKNSPNLRGSLRDCAATALREIHHQIWLLRNILWWYLLPLSVPMLLLFCWITWEASSPGESYLIPALLTLFWIGFVLLINISIYRLNQSAVKTSFEPRRRELTSLLAELETQDPSFVMKAKKPIGPLLLVLGVCIIAVLACTAKNAELVTSLTAPPTDKPVAVGWAETVPCLLPDLTGSVVFHPPGKQGASILRVPKGESDRARRGTRPLSRNWTGVS